MKVLGLIVARSGSSRVPGKSLIKIKDEPVIKHIIDIAKNIVGLDEICLSTTILSKDDELVKIAENENISIFRDDPENVLDRVYNNAKIFNADVVVYIGGDCPLLDPNIVSEALNLFLHLKCDYLNNYDNPSLPGGYDINIITFSALEKAFSNAIAPSQRVHAFSYLTFHPNMFNIHQFVYGRTMNSNSDLSTFHWSLDYPEDIEFIKAIYEKCYKKNSIITIDDILSCINEDNYINRLNNNLIKPKVSHSFFSSIGIMNDLIDDIAFLNNTIKDEINNNNIKLVEKLLSEIYLISRKMIKN